MPTVRTTVTEPPASTGAPMTSVSRNKSLGTILQPVLSAPPLITRDKSRPLRYVRHIRSFRSIRDFRHNSHNRNSCGQMKNSRLGSRSRQQNDASKQRIFQAKTPFLIRVSSVFRPWLKLCLDLATDETRIEHGSDSGVLTPLLKL